MRQREEKLAKVIIDNQERILSFFWLKQSVFIYFLFFLLMTLVK